MRQHAASATRRRPVASIANDGDSILQKAARLKKFVKQQKGKLEKSKGLHEWMITQQRLQDECGAAERDFIQAHAAVTELLHLEYDTSQESNEGDESTVLVSRIRTLWQNVGPGRPSHSAMKAKDQKKELQKELNMLKDEVQKEREELEFQAAACTSAAPSALLNETAQDLQGEWRARLEDVVSKYPDVFEDAERAEARSYLEILDTCYASKVSHLEATAPPSSHTGWSLEDHETFLRIRRAALAETSGTCQPQLEVTTKVCRMMPHKSQRDVAQHSEWYAGRLLWLRKLDDLHASHARQLEDFFQKLDVRLSKKAADNRTAAASAFDKIQREAAQASLQNKLANQRQSQAEIEQADLQKRLALVEADTEAKRQEEKKALAEKAKVRATLRKYHDEMEILARETAREEARGKLLREEAAKAAAVLNSERVEYRKREQIKKVEQLQKAAEASEAAQREKEERLAKLRAQVAVHVEADKSRVLKPTAALLAAENAAKDSTLFPVHGFKMDELMKDKRFRLGLALREAGLHTTSAGRNALLAAAPKEIRRDTLSSVTLGAGKLPR